MKKAVAVILLAFALTGCGEPKIDGSSEQAFQTSMQKVRDSLAEDKRAAVNDAIRSHCVQPGQYERVDAGGRAAVTKADAH
ncbi:DUF6694 family lipoprotein [Pantoea ananatis]